MSLVKIISQLAKASGSGSVTPAPSGGTDFYALSGQSNCGRSAVSQMTAGQQSNYAGAISGVQIMIPVPWYATNVSTQVYQQLNVGVNTYVSNQIASDEFGCEASLMKNLRAYKGADLKIAKFGVGNSDLANGWASNPSNSNAYRTILFDTIKRAAQLSNAVGETLNMKAFIWMQGENDATNSAWASAYLSNLVSFMNDFDANWQSVCALYGWNYVRPKKVIGRLKSPTGDGSQVYLSTVRAAQDSFCANPSNNAILINTDAYTQFDGVHFDATSQIQFGIDIFNQIKDL